MNLAEIYAGPYGPLRFNGTDRNIVIGYVVREKKYLFCSRRVFLLAYYAGEDVSVQIYPLLMSFTTLFETQIREMPGKHKGKMLSRGQFVFKHTKNIAEMIHLLHTTLRTKSGYSNPILYAKGPLDELSVEGLESIRLGQTHG